MFSSGPNYTKLKTNLRLAVNRLKLLEKKKTELAQKMRKEIADYISQNKEDRARIRVEHIIREDYLVEAFELLEMLCDLLLARFDLIQQMKTLDEGLEEAINTILWAAPRLQTEVPELKVISDQLTAKYGKPFSEACRSNQFAKVNQKLLQKLSVHTPSKLLVEKYMIEISRSHSVPFEPDKNIIRADEVAAAEAMLIDFKNRGGGGGSGGGGIGEGHYGWNVPEVNPGFMPGEAFAVNTENKPPVNYMANVPPPYAKDANATPSTDVNTSLPPYHSEDPPPLYPVIAGKKPVPAARSHPPEGVNAGDTTKASLLAYPGDLNLPTDSSASANIPADLCNLPDPPATVGTPNNDVDNKTSNKGIGTDNKNQFSPDEIDFDDLTKRFENLKKKR